MRRQQFLAVTVGVMVLSASLVLMTDSAGAAPPPKSTPTQNWDENLPSASRFTTAFTGAVQDNNTGLVWEQAPDATTRVWQNFTASSFGATSYCLNKNVGGTRGWRLPSVAELASLLDPSLAAPFVPASVFTGVQSGQWGYYWSATSVADSPTQAWVVGFNFGGVGDFNKTTPNYAWCVRGPMQESVY